MNKQSLIFLSISLFVVVTMILITSFVLNREEEENEAPFNSLMQEDVKGKIKLNEEEKMSEVTDFEKLEIKILKEGNGQEAKVGDTVFVNYEGTLSNGTKFDSSYDRGVPFEFTLGEMSVIQGWEEGVKGMKIGEIRELSIPSSMGYGSTGAGSLIPPYAGLIFKVELLQIK